MVVSALIPLCLVQISPLAVAGGIHRTSRRQSYAYRIHRPGRHGQGMAANLLKAGHEVVVWNRSPEPVQGLVAQGARAAASPRRLRGPRWSSASCQ